MKTITFFAFSFFLLFVISCKKTSIVEYDGPSANQGGDASFTLIGAPNACDAPYRTGSYVANVQTDSRNGIILSVNVTKTGSWTFATETVNGLQFSGSGNFTAKGRQLLNLSATGKPTIAGEYNFKPGTLPCSFQIIVVPDTSLLNTAKYSFKGSPGNCVSPAIFGTYELGQRLDGNTDYVVLMVDVTTPGTYDISTNIANGISFSAQGNFTAVGPNQPIVFKGRGQCFLPGDVNFKTADRPGLGDCSFTIKITAILKSITGTIKISADGIPYEFNEQLSMIQSLQGGVTRVFFFGKQSAPVVSNDMFYIIFLSKTGPVLPGFYNSVTNDSTGNNFSQVEYIKGDNNYWNINFYPFPREALTVNLTTYNSSTATGIFSGKLYRIRGTGTDSLVVTNGSFNLQL